MDTQVNFDGLLNKGGHILFERAKEAMQEDTTSAKENFKKAIRFYTLAYQERKKRTPTNPNVGNPLYNLANCYVKLYLITNDFEYLIHAEKGFRKAIKIRRDNGDFNSINLSQMNGNLGECLGVSLWSVAFKLGTGLSTRAGAQTGQEHLWHHGHC